VGNGFNKKEKTLLVHQGHPPSKVGLTHQFIPSLPILQPLKFNASSGTDVSGIQPGFDGNTQNAWVMDRQPKQTEQVWHLSHYCSLLLGEVPPFLKSICSSLSPPPPACSMSTWWWYGLCGPVHLLPSVPSPLHSLCPGPHCRSSHAVLRFYSMASWLHCFWACGKAVHHGGSMWWGRLLALWRLGSKERWKEVRTETLPQIFRPWPPFLPVHAVHFFIASLILSSHLPNTVSTLQPPNPKNLHNVNG
jgi:hypothetical protein